MSHKERERHLQSELDNEKKKRAQVEQKLENEREKCASLNRDLTARDSKIDELQKDLEAQVLRESDKVSFDKGYVRVGSLLFLIFLKLCRFKFLTAETQGRMGTNVGRSDFWDGWTSVSYDWSMSRRYSDAIKQSQVTLVHPMIPEIATLKELVPIPLVKFIIVFLFKQGTLPLTCQVCKCFPWQCKISGLTFSLSIPRRRLCIHSVCDCCFINNNWNPCDNSIKCLSISTKTH